MVFLTKFFTSVLLAVFLASPALSAPWPSDSKHVTHRVRNVGRDFKLESFHPESSFEVRPFFTTTMNEYSSLYSPQTFGEGIDHPLTKRADASLEDTALEFVKSRLSVDSSAVKFKSGFSGEVSSHAYVKQVHVRRLLC